MSTVNWSELPNDILGNLIGFLPLPDYHRFSVVCKNWCTVAREKHHHPAQQLPWLVMGEDIATRKRIFFNLSENKHYYMDLPELHDQFVCGSSFGWLFTVDIANFNICMLNPFTRKSYDLPRLYFRHQGRRIKRQLPWFVYKVILDHDPNERSDFTVMVIGCCKKKIAFWRQGDPTWTLPLLPHIYQYYTAINDIIFFKEKFYAAVRHQNDDQFFVVDVGPDSKFIPLQHQTPMIREFYKCLVDFKGELLLIQWDRGEEKLHKVDTINVLVHKLDFEEGTNYEVKHINNHAFFIGNNSPVLIDAAQFSGCTLNAIYFTQKILNSYQMARCNLETYNMVTKKLATYYQFANLSPLFVTPAWLAPKTW